MGKAANYMEIYSKLQILFLASFEVMLIYSSITGSRWQERVTDPKSQVSWRAVAGRSAGQTRSPRIRVLLLLLQVVTATITPTTTTTTTTTSTTATTGTTTTTITTTTTTTTTTSNYSYYYY